MIAPVPDRAASPERAVHSARDADRDAAEAAHEHRSIVGFDDHVDVILLNAELYDPETAVRGPRERAPDRGEHARRPQAANRGRCAQGHVDGMSRNVSLPTAMRNAGPSPRRKLTTRAASQATPRGSLGQCELQGACHLDRAILACYLAAVKRALNDLAGFEGRYDWSVTLSARIAHMTHHPEGTPLRYSLPQLRSCSAPGVCDGTA